MTIPFAQRRPGDDWSLHDLYRLVPDAYELDLLDQARREDVADPDVAGESHDDPGSEPVADGPEAGCPSVTQARFMVERLLGGEVVEGTDG